MDHIILKFKNPSMYEKKEAEEELKEATEIVNHLIRTHYLKFYIRTKELGFLNDGTVIVLDKDVEVKL